jgi:N6-L-threonylcarbamoyladenine synthase
LPDLCASFQEAIVDVLVAKTLKAAKAIGSKEISVSGGVSCNHRLRAVFTTACAKARYKLHLAEAHHTTDNAAMIAFAAVLKFARGETSPLTTDVDPNLAL